MIKSLPTLLNRSQPFSTSTHKSKTPNYNPQENSAQKHIKEPKHMTSTTSKEEREKRAVKQY